MGPAPVIGLDGLAKWFGPNPGLTDLHLRAAGGRITVLLGPNGAGKTTAICMITGAFAPDRGTVTVFGLDPARRGREVRSRPPLRRRRAGLVRGGGGVLALWRGARSVTRARLLGVADER